MTGEGVRRSAAAVGRDLQGSAQCVVCIRRCQNVGSDANRGIVGRGGGIGDGTSVGNARRIGSAGLCERQHCAGGIGLGRDPVAAVGDRCRQVGQGIGLTRGAQGKSSGLAGDAVGDVQCAAQRIRFLVDNQRTQGGAGAYDWSFGQWSRCRGGNGRQAFVAACLRKRQLCARRVKCGRDPGTGPVGGFVTLHTTFAVIEVRRNVGKRQAGNGTVACGFKLVDAFRDIQRSTQRIVGAEDRQSSQRAILGGNGGCGVYRGYVVYDGASAEGNGIRSRSRRGRKRQCRAGLVEGGRDSCVAFRGVDVSRYCGKRLASGKGKSIRMGSSAKRCPRDNQVTCGLDRIASPLNGDRIQSGGARGEGSGFGWIGVVGDRACAGDDRRGRVSCVCRKGQNRTRCVQGGRDPIAGIVDRRRQVGQRIGGSRRAQGKWGYGFACDSRGDVQATRSGQRIAGRGKRQRTQCSAGGDGRSSHVRDAGAGDGRRVGIAGGLGKCQDCIRGRGAGCGRGGIEGGRDAEPGVRSASGERRCQVGQGVSGTRRAQGNGVAGGAVDARRDSHGARQRIAGRADRQRAQTGTLDDCSRRRGGGVLREVGAGDAHIGVSRRKRQFVAGLVDRGRDPVAGAVDRRLQVLQRIGGVGRAQGNVVAAAVGRHDAEGAAQSIARGERQRAHHAGAIGTGGVRPDPRCRDLDAGIGGAAGAVIGCGSRCDRRAARLCRRGEGGVQAQAGVVDGADQSLRRVGVVGARAHADIRVSADCRAVRPLGQIADVDSGGTGGVQAVGDRRIDAGVRQVDKYIALAVAIGHHAVGIAQVGRRQRRNVQSVDRRARRGRVAGEDVGLRVEDRLLVIGGGGADVRDFRQDRLVLLVCGQVLVRVEGAVRGFGSQRHGPVEQVRHLRQRAIGHRQQAHTFSRIRLRLGQGRGIGLQAVYQRKTGCVVRAGVDLRSGRQLLQHGVQAVVGGVQAVLRVDGGEVVQDAQGHGVLLVGCVDLRPVPVSAPIFCVTLGCCFRSGYRRIWPLLRPGTYGLYHPPIVCHPRTLPSLLP